MHHECSSEDFLRWTCFARSQKGRTEKESQAEEERQKALMCQSRDEIQDHQNKGSDHKTILTF